MVTAMVRPEVIRDFKHSAGILVLCGQHPTDLMCLQLVDMSSDTAFRLAKSDGQLLLRYFKTSSSPVGFQAHICEQLECAIGQQCQGLPEAVSGSKPTGRLFQAERPILQRKGWGIHRFFSGTSTGRG